MQLVDVLVAIINPEVPDEAIWKYFLELSNTEIEYMRWSGLRRIFSMLQVSRPNMLHEIIRTYEREHLLGTYYTPN